MGRGAAKGLGEPLGVLDGVQLSAGRGGDAVAREPPAARIGGEVGEDVGADEGQAEEVRGEARRRGAYLRPLGNVVYVAPPVNVPEADLAELLGIVRASVEAACAP